MMIDPTELNEIEQRAVNWNTGPLLVLADSNVDRRSVVSYRMERFLKPNPNSSSNILALTHSSMSVDEMRYQIWPPYEYDEDISDKVATFSEFAAGTFEPNEWEDWDSEQENFDTIIAESEQLLFLDEIISMTAPEYTGLLSKRLLPLINRLFEGDVEPDRVAQMLKEQSFSNPEVLARIYQNYREQMLAKRLLDSSGLIAAVLLIHKKISYYYKGLRRPKNLCIDDFQNLTTLEYRLIKYMLDSDMEKHMVDSDMESFFVIADDTQMFKRLDLEGIDRMRDMQQRFKMDICLLPANHDCPPEIAAVGNRLASQNFKEPTAGTFNQSLNGNGNGNAVDLHQFADFAEEIQWIASDIANREESFRQNCAVVANSKGILSRIAETLQQQGIAGYLPFGRQVFESVQMNWLIAVLRFADFRNSDEYLRQACWSFYRLTGIVLNIRDITTYATVEKCDNLRSWTEAVLNHADTTWALRQMIVGSMVPHLVDRIDFQSFQDSAFEWLDGMDISVSEGEDFIADFASERSAWHDMVAKISKQYNGSMLSLYVLIRELDRLTQVPPQPENAVPCLPMRALNGREFDHVYFVGMMEGNVPSQNSIRFGDSSYAMQEERRICASIITSANKSLTFTCSDSMDGVQTYPSRFLHETGLLKFADASGQAARNENGSQ